jgi:hypothetical protein
MRSDYDVVIEWDRGLDLYVATIPQMLGFCVEAKSSGGKPTDAIELGLMVEEFHLSGLGK